jgi:RNA polymerase sigma factor (sigma-70 family)
MTKTMTGQTPMPVTELQHQLVFDPWTDSVVDPINSLLEAIRHREVTGILCDDRVVKVPWASEVEVSARPAPANPDGAAPNRVRAFRQRQGWTQQELAEASGVSRADIVALEAGRPLRGPGLVIARKLNHVALALEQDFDMVFPKAYQRRLTRDLQQRRHESNRHYSQQTLEDPLGWRIEIPIDSVNIQVDSAETESFKTFLVQDVHAVLACLPEIEQVVLIYRFMLDLTYREIGECIGVKRHTARRMVETALRRLGHPYHNRMLRDWLRE